MSATIRVCIRALTVDLWQASLSANFIGQTLNFESNFQRNPWILYVLGSQPKTTSLPKLLTHHRSPHLSTAVPSAVDSYPSTTVRCCQAAIAISLTQTCNPNPHHQQICLSIDSSLSLLSRMEEEMQGTEAGKKEMPASRSTSSPNSWKPCSLELATSKNRNEVNDIALAPRIAEKAKKICSMANLAIGLIHEILMRFISDWDVKVQIAVYTMVQKFKKNSLSTVSGSARKTTNSKRLRSDCWPLAARGSRVVRNRMMEVSPAVLPQRKKTLPTAVCQ
ncbi:unnamed protein product [Dovyalis caffra]|uniref:Uncharacterized protein n=1 Tax=Dovyalis caffra TaxID=77055 RepID=A0AAV1QXT9_9ROSI|nr:unnamed protein product [Dovyalis caffra]